LSVLSRPAQQVVKPEKEAMMHEKFNM